MVITAHQDAAAIYRETGDEYYEAIVRANLDEALAAWQARGTELRE